VRGPATLLYGSNAVGGLVNVITPQESTRESPFEGTRAQLSADLGSANAQAGANVGLQHARNGVHYWAGGSTRRTEDYATPLGTVENSATDSTNARAGVGWSGDRPKRSRERNECRRLQVGLTATLPRGFTVGGSAALRWTDYEGDWFPFTDGRSREDLSRILRLNVHHRAFTLWGFSPRLSVVREERSSNAQLHDYERTFGELSFVRLF